MSDPDLINLPRSQGGELLKAGFKTTPADFQVRERLVYEPSGEGEYLWLRLRKTGVNTSWLARELAGSFAIPEDHVSYAGLKDRQAVTEQWFSVKTSEPSPPDRWFEAHPTIECLELTRNSAPLSRRDVLGNAFSIRLRDAQGADGDWQARMEGIIGVISEQGVPNYFGPQRFGRDGANLDHAEQLFAGERVNDRFLRGIYLSAARSHLFNQVLAARVKEGRWNRPMKGEAFIEARGGGSVFLPWPSEPAQEQLDAWKIHPSGPLPGVGQSVVKKDAAAFESEVLADYPSLVDGLSTFRVRAGRRALRMRPRDMDWRAEGDDLILEFSLGPGEYATSLLRELVTLDWQ